MKTWIFFTIFCILFDLTTLAQKDSVPDFSNRKIKIYKFEIKEQIAPPAARTTQMAIKKAKELEADILFIEMDTYGGLVDAADEIRTAILQSPIFTVVWIENNAASAGALISIACDRIYMRPGATIGAATVVNQTGEAVPDKFQSYMRKKMRATAEEKGRNPDIAEAMVDPDKVVPGVSDSGKVVTFTTTEALIHGFADGEAKTFEDVLGFLGVKDYDLIVHEIKGIDKIINKLINPAVSGILITVIILGIFFELQTPGVGFPLVAAITAAILYFAPLYLEGLATNLEIVMFFIGLILLAVEIFVIPGFGVAGIAGALIVLTSLTLSLVDSFPDGGTFPAPKTDDLLKALLTVFLSIIASGAIAILLGKNMLKFSFAKGVILDATTSKEFGYVSTDENVKSVIGKTGVATTVLRPVGKVEIDGVEYEAASALGYIEKGDVVKVTSTDMSTLIVVKV